MPRKTLIAVAFRVLTAVSVLPMLAVTALAEKKDVESFPPYVVVGYEPGSQWIGWVLAFLFAVGCLLMAFKNPHRSHLD